MGTAILTQIDELRAVFMPDLATSVLRQRLNRFLLWVVTSGCSLYMPNLADWRDDLLREGLAPTSVRAYLATVRSRYRELLSGRILRERLYTVAGNQLRGIGAEDSPANRYALVSEALTCLHNALAPSASRVTVPLQQDRVDTDHLRLSREQAETLLAMPGCTTVMGLRDTALIAILLCTGIREGEVVNLEIADLRQRVNGELGLLVRKGKGSKTRFVPYGGLSWSLIVVDAWLKSAGIMDGVVFRAILRGGHVQTTAITTRTVQRIVARYPVVIDGERRRVKPHDCRRTYAARQYAAGMDLNALRQNLGHTEVKTTLGYIGDMAIETRRGQAVYNFDIRGL